MAGRRIKNISDISDPGMLYLRMSVLFFAQL